MNIFVVSSSKIDRNDRDTMRLYLIEVLIYFRRTR